MYRRLRLKRGSLWIRSTHSCVGKRLHTFTSGSCNSCTRMQVAVYVDSMIYQCSWMQGPNGVRRTNYHQILNQTMKKMKKTRKIAGHVGRNLV